MKLPKNEIEAMKSELYYARIKFRGIKKEIDNLRQAIINGGGKPDPPRPDLVPRNKEIYRKWKSGLSFTEIARLHRVSTTTISAVCYRIEHILELKGINFKKYKSLLKYKQR